MREIIMSLMRKQGTNGDRRRFARPLRGKRKA